MMKQASKPSLPLGSFELECISCKKPVIFSPVDLEVEGKLIACPHCRTNYGFQEESLKRQLKKFAALCRQIRDSEEILSTASISVEVGQNKVNVPFKLLLSRLKSTLELKVGEKKLVIAFRVEPTRNET